MNTSVIADWVRLGLSAVTFILVGKFLFVGYHVPVLDKLFGSI